MRREMTESERKLWQALRAGRLGHRFRRQEPIGPYIVDFVCKERRLVVEVDGIQHLDRGYDVARDRRLEQYGYRVLRFWNSEIHENLEGVLDWIATELERPSP